MTQIVPRSVEHYQELARCLEQLEPGIAARIKRDPSYISTQRFLELARRAHVLVDPDGVKFPGARNTERSI